MNLLSEQLARVRCSDLRATAERENMARRVQRQRRGSRMARRADRLAARAGGWREASAR